MVDRFLDVNDVFVYASGHDHGSETAFRYLFSWPLVRPVTANFS